MTQKEKVMEVFFDNKPRHYIDVADEIGILIPNVRRILGTGVKEGDFERIARGVYVLVRQRKVVAYIKSCDSIEMLPYLAREGFKADMIFLDPPYRTPATAGGNRPMRFPTIEPDAFSRIASAVFEIARCENTPVFYMFSRAASGLKKMRKYTDCLINAGLRIVTEGNYQKMYSNGKPIVNVCGEVAVPEGIMLLTQSGEFEPKDEDLNLDFTLIRPGPFPTQKPIKLGRSLIRQSTNQGELILDPFVGSGMMIKAALKENRRIVAFDISENFVDNIIAEQKPYGQISIF